MQQPQLRNHGYSHGFTEMLLGRDFWRSLSPASCLKQDQHHQQIRSALALSDSAKKSPRVEVNSLSGEPVQCCNTHLAGRDCPMSKLNLPRQPGPTASASNGKKLVFFLCNTLPVAQVDFRSPPWYPLHQKTGPSSPTSPDGSQTQSPSPAAQASPSTPPLN